jgi:hypothetical protein
MTSLEIEIVVDECGVRSVNQSNEIGRRAISKFTSKFYYVKMRFPITLKCRQMHEVLNVDDIIN